MILTTPLFSEIKNIFPESKLIVLASSINCDIPLNHTSVDEVIVFKKNILKNITLIGSSLKNIDYWIDTKFNHSKTSELLLKIFKPKKSFGFNFEKNIFNVSLNDYKSGNHAVNINLSPVNYFKNTKDKITIRPFYEIPQSVRKTIDKHIKVKPGIKNIAVNVSAGNRSRYLQKEKWNVIINKIHQTNLYNFNLIGMEEDMEIIDYILDDAMGTRIHYLKSKSIIETSEIVRRNDIIITPDTSIVHICSAFNKPVIALYPDVKWNFEKFAPLSDKHEAIISTKANSIEDIKADEVVERFKNLESDI